MNKVDMDDNIAIACKVALKRNADPHGILKMIEDLIYLSGDDIKKKLNDDEWKLIAEPILNK